MKVKLIYKDDTDKYFIRYSNGKSKIVKLNEAYHLAEENKIGIGDSEYNESRNVKLDWTDGTPAPPTREEYQKEYYINNKERLVAYHRKYYRKNRDALNKYQREYKRKKKQLDKTLVSE